MKKILELVLRAYASAVLRIYTPTIIGVTGSVGKTSAKEAIAVILSSKYAIRKNVKNYNNELGVPLTILGTESAGRSFLGWCKVLLCGTRLLFFRQRTYPNILVLELGADHPGDIKQLTDFVYSHVGVLTAIEPAHTEFFGSVERVFSEKRILIDRLPADGIAVLNADDPRVASLAGATTAKVLTYGFANHATIRATEVAVASGEDGQQMPRGMMCKIEAEGSVVPMFLPGVAGRQHVYAVLAAIAVARAFDIHLIDAVRALASYHPSAGRMTLLPGKVGSILLDDSYNSSPAALRAALEVLADFPNATRRVACLGTMAELGSLFEREHATAGRRVAELRLNVLVAIGDGGKQIAAAAAQSGMASERIEMFATSDDAATFLHEHLQHGDVVLIKGSQVVRMERIVKVLMAEPDRAEELLVRQGEEWR
ncbi:MAG: UDP-N-acetylmuramoyl-tripeptide--D-alanyl-D-alanine ligase [bacterium]